MDQLPPILVLLAVFALLLALMALGWRARARRQLAAGLPAPVPAPEPGDPPADAGAPGVYVTTVLAGRPLERVTAHGLGGRSRVLLDRGTDADGRPGWVLRRQGAPSFLVPDADLETLTTAPGMAGKWMGGEALLVLRWRLGPETLETGLRLDSRADHDRLLAGGATAPARTTTTPTSAPISRKETP